VEPPAIICFEIDVFKGQPKVPGELLERGLGKKKEIVQEARIEEPGGDGYDQQKSQDLQSKWHVFGKFLKNSNLYCTIDFELLPMDYRF